MDKKKLNPLARFRGFIQAGATLLTNLHLPNFAKGTLYQGSGKYVCVPGLNCYSCPGAAGACPVGAFQAVIGSSKFRFSYYITGILILFGVLLERFNIRYTRISQADLRKNPLRDTGWGVSSTAISVAILSIFAVIFVVPLVEQWPYQTSFSLEHFAAVFTDSELITVYWHSLVMALLTAFLGTLAAYGAALITARSTLPPRYKRVIESIALVTNAIPGMVLGVAYLFLFSGSGLQNTLLLMILCNIVHYFSTPYLMMKNSLSKMNAGWETTAMLMGDSWLQTILRVVTPNALSSLIEVFSYYFINSMVTISALIFIAGARTMVLTTMIKQLQYVNRFNEVFVLSLLILATNLIAKGLFSCLASYKASHPVKERRSIQLFGNRKEAVQ